MHQKSPYLVDIIRVRGELYGFSALYYIGEFNKIYLSSKRSTFQKLINTLCYLKEVLRVNPRIAFLNLFSVEHVQY